ncbi:integumentary mucin C.1 [Oreochromis niloticus]|uniref:integumentary mucin C.1 n=1 Tax=Oreochromis niloticus TaxID=8128 RepID=UPI0009053DEB|nr:integumentary mucin C.1 [Oreochromis niloticus]
MRYVTFRSLQSNFEPDLLNSSSASFKNRSLMIKRQIEPVYSKAFPSSFISLDVVSFRKGSVINTMELQFVNFSVPNYTEIRNVLISQASNVTGFDIERASINISDTAPTTTTATPPETTATTTKTPVLTTTTTAAATPTTIPTTKAPTGPVQIILFLQFLEPYVPQLTDPTSSAYQDRKKRVEETCDRIYRAEFFNFIRAIVIGFRSVIVQKRVDRTEAVVELVFNQTIPNAQVPDNITIVQALRDAINSSSINFTIQIVPETVSVTSVPVIVTDNSTTPLPTTVTSTTAAPTTSSTTAAPTTSSTTAAPSTSSTTASATTVVPATTGSSGVSHKINPRTAFLLVLMLWLLSSQQ